MECGINNFRCPIDVCVSFDELGNKSDFFDDLKLVLRNILDDKTMKVFDDKVGILAIMDKPGFLRCSSVSHEFLECKIPKYFACHREKLFATPTAFRFEFSQELHFYHQPSSRIYNFFLLYLPFLQV